MAISPISIQPKFVYGLRSDVKGNIHFLENQEIVYPVAGVIAIHDFKRQKQTFLRLSETSSPTVITISPNRKILAVAEWIESNQLCIINTYDVNSLKKKKTLKLPKDVPTQNVEALRFTEDSRGLAVLSKEPDAFLTIFYFDKSETVIVGRVSNGSQPGLTTDVLSCNLNDSGLVAVGGQYTFKLMSRQDKSFGMIGTMSGEHKVITSLVWLTPEILVAGTSANQLLFIESGDPKQNFEANTVHLIDLERAKDLDNDQPPLKLNSVSIRTHKTEVNCLTNFEKGFCYALYNQLYVFEKEKSYIRYMRRSIIEIPIDLYPSESYTIKNVSINIQVDTVIVTTKHSQIYISKLMELETVALQHIDFVMLGEPLHIAGIIGMSICSWKPIVMTAANDFTVRIWNYDTLNLELVKKFQFSIHSIALHPTGLFVAIGFSDQLHLMEILLKSLKTVKTFGFPNCNEIAFSHQGHLLACAYGCTLTIVSVFSFQTLKSLKGHRGKILSISWSVNDAILVSSGDDGAIYQWCVSTGDRLNELVEKGTEFRSLALTNTTSVYVCTNSGIFREIHQTDIIREIDPDNGKPLTQIALSRSNLMFFIGSESGNLYNIQVPFLEAGGGTCTNYRFFSEAVSRMKITFDDRLLVVGSSDGTLVIWYIVNSEGKTAMVDSEHGKCTDIIVSRNDLIEKNDKIEILETRLNQLSTEHSFEMEHDRKIHSIELQKISKTYEKTINELIDKQQFLEIKYREEVNVINATIQERNIEHSNEMIELEAKLCEKILAESNKSAAFKVKMDQAKEDYENLLRKSAARLQDTTNVLEKTFNDQLKKREDEIRALLDEIQTKKEEFFHYCNQLNLDHDRKIAQLTLKYETQLKEANDEIFKWRTEVNILTKKINGTTQSHDQLKNDVITLIEENNKNKKYINQLEQNVSEAQRDIVSRTRTADDKETCLKTALDKIDDLEKMKNHFNDRAIELEAQIKPLKDEIKEKFNQITTMKVLEIKTNQKLDNLNIEIARLNDRLQFMTDNFKVEQTKNAQLNTQIHRMCADIFEMVENIQNQSKLKEVLLLMFHKYIKMDVVEHKKLKLTNDDTVAADRRKQLQKSKAEQVPLSREHLDKMKLIKENLYLISEIDKFKGSIVEYQQKIIHLESMVEIQKID